MAGKLEFAAQLGARLLNLCTLTGWPVGRVLRAIEKQEPKMSVYKMDLRELDARLAQAIREYEILDGGKGNKRKAEPPGWAA